MAKKPAKQGLPATAPTPLVTVKGGALVLADDVGRLPLPDLPSDLGAPTATALKQIAAGLDVALKRFLSEAHAKPPNELVRKWASRVRRHATTLLDDFELASLHDGRVPDDATGYFADALWWEGDKSPRARFNIEQASVAAFDEPAPGFREVDKAMHAVRFLVLLSERLGRVRAAHPADLYVIRLVEASVVAYERLTGLDGTSYATSASGTEQAGPAARFHQGVLKLLSTRLVERLADIEIVPANPTRPVKWLAAKLDIPARSLTALLGRLLAIRQERQRSAL